MRKWDLTKKGQTVEKAYEIEKNAGSYNEIFKKYRDPATRYAFAVLEGRRLAGKKIKLDAFRHLQDLRRQTEDPDFKYHYDLDKCRAIINYSKLVPDVNAGKPLPLMVWEQKILCSIIGWRDDNDQLRYMRVIYSVARTNGKTYIATILMSFYFLVESKGQMNHDYLYTAPVTSQSQKGFQYMQSFFTKLSTLPAFKKLFKQQEIVVLHDVIMSRKLHNRLLRMSYKSGQFDSLHCQFAVGDEVGDDHHIGSIIEGNGKITSGQGQEPNHCFLQVSTAYPDSNSQFYKDQQMMEEVMERDYDRSLDDNLCMIWEQDSLDETNRPETWVKSNPILDLSPEKHDQLMKSLLSERDTKMANGSLPEFQNKSLNMWLQVKQNTYLDLDDINRAAVDDAPIEIDGKECYVGFDKSNFSDDTSIAFVFPYLDNGKPRYYVKQHSWVPLARAQNNIVLKEKQDGINYRDAEKQGFCDIAKNDYGYIDDGAVFDWLMAYVEAHKLKIKYFCYDKWGLSKMIGWIEQKTEWNTMPVKNVIQNLNEPTVDLRKQFDTGTIRYDHDPIITYSLKNAVLYGNNNGVKIDKEKATTKIDFVDALIDAWYTAMFHFDDISLEKFDAKNPFSGMSNDDINDYFTNDFSF